MAIYLGIDLGTTNSVVCHKNKEFSFAKDEFGHNLIPSVVCYSDSETYVGREAVENEDNFPESTIRSSKRHIGTQAGIYQNLTAKDIAKDILVFLKSLGETNFDESIEGIVITVPAYFNQNQRLETKLAAEEAGLNVVRIINEPTAAALAYGEDSKLNETVLIYDLGGGTFDVTLLKMTDDNVYQVLSTSGDTKLGGDDFDEIIVEVFKSGLPAGFKPFKDFDVRLKKFAEEVKVHLNYRDTIKKTLKYCGTIDGRLYHHNFHLTSLQYEQKIRPLLLKTKSHVLNALNDANVKISNIDKIILVGGSTKSKFVRKFVSEEFRAKVYHDIDPDLTVAAGAANLAHTIASKTKDGVLLIDVTPLSLGIETKGGLLNKIIPRNTSIPVSASQEYITAEDNQDRVNIKIYQGERPLAKNNELLGEFELSGFEKRPKGQTKIVVKFDIDASGLITVTAFDKISGTQSCVTLKPLSSDIVNELLNDLERNDEAEAEALAQIELESLRQEARTLMLSRNIMDQSEDRDTYESVKDNIGNLKVFIQSLRD